MGQLGRRRPAGRLAATSEPLTAETPDGTTSTTPEPVRPVPSVPFDIVEEWGRSSFPASDPPSNW